MLGPPTLVSKAMAVQAASALAHVDYSVATRVSHGAALAVAWAYDHEMWWIATTSMRLVQLLDDTGSHLITLVVWLVLHAH